MLRGCAFSFFPLLMVVSGCRLEITVPEGGVVESASGTYYCGTGETCVIDVNDTHLDEEFIASPDIGYVFNQWVKKPKGFCGNKSMPCPLSTTSFKNNNLLLSLLQSNEVFYLEPVFRKPDSYVPKRDMMLGGASRATCAVNEKLYVFGSGWETGSPLDITQEYDPATDIWAHRASMPSPRSWATATSLKGECYVIGGSPGGLSLADVEVYNPKADSWRSAAPIPEARFSASSAVVDGKLYLIGGSGDFLGTFAAVYPDVFVYDPGADTWSAAADIPTPRRRMGVGVVNGRIYTIGGENQAAGVVESNVVESYDPATNQWRSHARLPRAVTSPAVSVIHEHLYVFGGFSPAPAA